MVHVYTPSPQGKNPVAESLLLYDSRLLWCYNSQFFSHKYTLQTKKIGEFSRQNCRQYVEQMHIY